MYVHTDGEVNKLKFSVFFRLRSTTFTSGNVKQFYLLQYKLVAVQNRPSYHTTVGGISTYPITGERLLMLSWKSISQNTDTNIDFFKKYIRMSAFFA